MIFLFPLVIVGIVAPVYVGYWRGAVGRSGVDRIRGWVYLFFGAGAYLWFILMQVLIENLQMPDSLLLPIATVILLLFFCFSFKMADWVKRQYNYDFALDRDTIIQALRVSVAYAIFFLFIWVGTDFYRLYSVLPTNYILCEINIFFPCWLYLGITRFSDMDPR